ncbi:MAG TPA: pentapeptide repeat-containing protein [Micropepsaceae bacterium]|nr:pentapeptide repeat-containing protein [Micropepsaceae bacterium]
MSSIADPSVDEAAIGAINDAAGYCRTLWATFIGYAATIFVLTSGTTHEALLRRTPVKLPLFNVDSGIPLLLFYVIAPLLLVLFHLNLLMKLHDLRVRVSELIIPLNWTDEANAAFERSRLRRRLMAFDYAVLKAGLVTDRRERVLLRLVTDATIFIMPVLLLLFVQLQFLPYHDWKISWLHRVFVVLDLGLIAYIQLWLGKKSTPDEAAIPHRSVNPRAILWGVLFAGPVLGSIFLLAFPGEAQDVFWKSVSPRPYAPLAGGDVAEKFGIRRSLYLADRSLWAVEPSEELLRALTQDSTIIALHGVDDAGPELLRTVQRIRNAALSLRGRNLSYANFESSTLIAADFSPDLNNEQVRAFQDTRFAATRAGNLIEPDNRTDISGASFSGADLRGVRLPYAQAENAAFFRANLQSAVLAYGQFANTNFAEARLQETDLYGARLQSVVLQSASLQGAILGRAQLGGANLRDTQLRNADLRGAAVTAEQLRAAQWQGAMLDGAVMEQLKAAPSSQAREPAPQPAAPP